MFTVPLEGILELPALVMFRNGGMVVIYGDNVQVSFSPILSLQNPYFASRAHLKMLLKGGNGEAAEGLADCRVNTQNNRRH